jgi:site-specific DNA recombinase
MKAIILARVSDKKQDSNEAQVVRVSDYIKRTGLTVWKTYEIEESSTKGDRKKYQEAVTDVEKANETIAIVVDTVDRLQRSFKESVQLDELRKAGKLEIHFYREGLVLRKDSNSSELLRWDMAVMFARSYVLQLSDNVKRKIEQMLRAGEWTGRPPIGYESIYDADGKRTDIVFDPNKAHLIQKMFELYATDNYSTLTIRDLMFKEGLQSSVGKPLALSMVDHIFNNTFYYGQMVSKGKSYQHKYQPLITKELFDKCQRIRKGWNKKPFQYASKPFVLRGLVRCGKCGCSMSPSLAKGTYAHYRCSGAKKALCDGKVTVSEIELLKPLYEVLVAFSNIPQEKIDQLVEGLKQSTDAKNVYHKNAIDSFQSEYNAIQVKIDRLMDLLIDGSITKTDYDKKLKEFKEKQYDINIQLEEHTKADESYYLTASTVFNLAKDALELFESSEVLEKRAILNYILQNYTVNEKTPCITMRSPFKELLSLTTQPMGLPR